MINAQYRTTVKPTFATGGEELSTNGISKVDEGDEGKVNAELKNTQNRLQKENDEIRTERVQLKLETEESKKVNELALKKEIASTCFETASIQSDADVRSQ